MKQTVIEFFQNLPDEKSEQFNKAFELYRKSPNKNAGVERSLNMQGYSERTLENLLYDLQKMHGISDVEKIKVIAPKKEIRTLEPFILAFSEEELRAWAQTECVEKGVGLEEVIVIALESEENTIAAILQEEYDVIKSNQSSGNSHPGTPINDIVVNGLKEENEVLLSEKEELEGEKEVLEDENEALKEKVNELTAVTGTALREEFLFLNDKDCPNELKILVADKMTAFKIYEDNHAQLLKIESGELVVSDEEQTKIAEAAKVAFEENQAIYAELNAYKETGKVLGKHPIFKTLQFQREVEEMTPDQLVKYKGSSAKYFTDNKDSLAKAEKEKDEEKIEKIKTRVADRELKLAMVNKKIGIPAK